MGIEINPLSDALGAEIVGLDLRRELSGAAFHAIHDAWRDYQVLVFRDQDLTTAEQKRFAQYFGPLGERGSSATGSGSANDDEELLLISNIREDGKPIGALPDGEMFFHSDQCYVALPYKATLLFGIEVPDRGGETLFANLYRAYDSLSSALRAKLDGKRALHVYNYQQTAQPHISGELGDLSQYPHHAHPVFRRHPVSGRTALFVNRLMTMRIEDIPGDEGAVLLNLLYDATERPELVYAHSWRKGDLVMWDNRCVNHGRADFDPNQRRLMRRCTVRGERPLQG